MQRSPGTPNGDVIEHSDDEKDRQEYLEVNFKYPLMLDTKETVSRLITRKKKKHWEPIVSYIVPELVFD